MSVTGNQLHGTKVLVAEDEPIVALDISLTLLEAGAEVVGPAGNVTHALELAERQELSCGILDVRLDGRLIFPAAQVLKKKGVHIIFYTGQADPEGLKREWPDAEVLMKPVSAQALMRAVISACRQPVDCRPI